MRQVQTHTIDSTVYKIQQLGAKQGRTVLARMLRMIGGAVAAENSFAELAKGLTDEELTYLCDTFAACTMFSTIDAPNAEFRLIDRFDDHFAGAYGAMVRWLWASVQTNYASFLGELPGLLAQAQSAGTAAMPKIQTSPTTQSGDLFARVGGVSSK